jgi:hypothetical protein
MSASEILALAAVIASDVLSETLGCRRKNALIQPRLGRFSVKGFGLGWLSKNFFTEI